VTVKVLGGGKKTVWVDRKFRTALRPQTAEERAAMEENLSAHTFALLTVWIWHRKRYLLDGHRALAFALAHDKPVRIQVVKLPNRAAALLWIRTNQMGRRNWTREEAVYHVGSLYNEARRPHGGDRKSAGARAGARPSKTADALAARFNLAPATVRNAADFAAAVDAIDDACGAEVRRRILAGESGLTQRTVLTLARQHQDRAALREATKGRLAEASGQKPAKRKAVKLTAGGAADDRPLPSKVKLLVNLCRQLFKAAERKPEVLAYAVRKTLGPKKAAELHRHLGLLLKASDKSAADATSAA
jgi:hypothetical protein